MPRICVALRHLPFEDLGVFAGVLEGAGYGISIVDVGIDDFGAVDAISPDLLVVLGGPIGAYETAQYPFLAAELDLIGRRLGAGKPTLGICLGLQLIAAALGAEVRPGNVKEIGWAPIDFTKAGADSLLAPLAGLQVLHWHGDVAALPEGAVCLATTPACGNQALAIGDHVLALQFHMEADPARIEHWLIGHAVELAAAGVPPSVIRGDTTRYGTVTARAGAAILNRWLARLA